MSSFPHSHLFIGPARTALVSGPHIQILDTTTGNVLASTNSFADAQKKAVTKSGPVRCAAVDETNTYLITSGDDKKLKVWQLDGLVLLSEREPPKKPTTLRFTKGSQMILASDKFGDVFSYPLSPQPEPAPTAPKTKLSSHENTAGGQLVLGHASLLTSFILTPDERYIITADRDEHIRVSWYPQGYNVEMYCLGHRKWAYVSAIHLPPNAPSTLISGGGDPMLKIWDWMTGKVQYEIPILSTVEPFIKVRPIKRKRGDDDENGGGEDGGEKRVAGRKARRKSNKSKGKAAEVSGDGDAEEADVDAEGEVDDEAVEDADAIAVDEPDGSTPAVRSEEPVAEAPATLADLALVVSKIETLGSHILFSAVGASALFAVPHSSAGATGPIESLDFTVPVIDFFLQTNGSLWVLLDSRYNGADDVSAVAIVNIIDGKLVLSTTPNALLSTINSSSTLLPATPSDLKTLDLYNAVTSMPKNNEVEHDAMERHEDATEEEKKDKDKGKAKGQKAQAMNKKQLGRLKNKQTLAAKAQAVGTAVSGGREDGKEGGVEFEDREKKRSKSEHGDVVME